MIKRLLKNEKIKVIYFLDCLNIAVTLELEEIIKRKSNLIEEIISKNEIKMQDIM